MGYLPWDLPAQIEIVSGAFCMLRRQALDEIGLLDEDFFMYGEDIDLSYRLLKGGWENWYLPLKILHYKGESTQKTNFRYVHVFYEAMFIFLRKHYGHLGCLLSLPIHIGIYCKACLALVSTLFEKVKYSMGFVSRRRAADARYIFDVDEDNRDVCRQLIHRHGLTAVFAGEKEMSDSYECGDDDRVNYYVYDISKYSFNEMLESLSAHFRDNQQFALYNPALKALITDSEIIQ